MGCPPHDEAERRDDAHLCQASIGTDDLASGRQNVIEEHDGALRSFYDFKVLEMGIGVTPATLMSLFLRPLPSQCANRGRPPVTDHSGYCSRVVQGAE